jgi:hypothetical protein
MDFRRALVLGWSKVSSDTQQRGTALRALQRGAIHTRAVGGRMACGCGVCVVAVLIARRNAIRCFVRAAVEHLRDRVAGLAGVVLLVRFHQRFEMHHLSGQSLNVHGESSLLSRACGPAQPSRPQAVARARMLRQLRIPLRGAWALTSSGMPWAGPVDLTPHHVTDCIS